MPAASPPGGSGPRPRPPGAGLNGSGEHQSEVQAYEWHLGKPARAIGERYALAELKRDVPPIHDFGETALKKLLARQALPAWR